jgi:alpha-D-xyloside xylohydrolase
MLFPYWHTQMVYEGLVAAGITDPVTLTRSAWAGMSRWGAGLWSGDTTSDWRSLRASVPAGLSVQLSGITLWTTDIGGYANGDPSDPGE